MFRRKIIQNWVVWNYFWPELESPLALNMPFILALELCSRRWGRAQAQCHVSEQNTHFRVHSHCPYLIACEYLTGNGTGCSAFNAFRKQIIGKLLFAIVKGMIVLLDWPKPNCTRDAKDDWQSVPYWVKMRFFLIFFFSFCSLLSLVWCCLLVHVWMVRKKSLTSNGVKIITCHIQLLLIPQPG